MKKLILILFITLASCNSVTIVITPNEYGKPKASTNDLSVFKDNNINNQVYELKGQELINELEKIKNMRGRENIVPSIIKYAFVVDRDTIYASPKLELWLVDNKIVIYRSEIIRVEMFE